MKSLFRVTGNSRDCSNKKTQTNYAMFTFCVLLKIDRRMDMVINKFNIVGLGKQLLGVCQ